MKKLLFLGNSHTYYQHLPFLFAAVCGQAGVQVHATMLTYPCCDLRWHLDWHCALPNIRMGGYDFVVLQQRSHPFDGEAALLCQGKELHEAITQAGAKTVLFETWSEQRNSEGQAVIQHAFEALLAACPGALLAPCGQTWHTLRGKIDLYHADGEHQNAKGAYLNACVLANTALGINPLELPGIIELCGQPLDVDEKDIRLLQKAAAMCGKSIGF